MTGTDEDIEEEEKEVEIYRIKKLLQTLKKIRGQHTALVSFYIPSGYSIIQALQQIQQEQFTAENIKSRVNRKNVTDALEKTAQHLKLFKKTPPHGLIVFCGNVSEIESIPDIKIWSLEPPQPLTIKLYRCDQQFITQPLEDIVSVRDVYGLIAIDNNEATIGVLKGDHYTILKKTESGYHGKHRAGGQSARRYERLIEEQSHNFKKFIGDSATQIFMPMLKELKGIIIGGPGATKLEFIEEGGMNHELKKKITAIKDISYTDESGIRELIQVSKDDLKEVQMVRQQQIMARFMLGLVKDAEPVSYGEEAKKHLEMSAVDILLLSEEIGDEEIDRLYEIAKKSKTRVELLPTTFEEGFQLEHTFGGVGAILRYRVSE
ncbi:Peptide chain release factor subunit 1 [groundwater metagenome]|uniref:Peptide chain release factor subunit 1 n=1 Tax=groundwater metagenome TaxID=717931 RepID=A0A098E9U7_9ZZZZ